MAIQETKKQSDLEKRLQILRRQAYGGKPIETVVYKSNNQLIHQSANTTDINFLRQDLIKITIFSLLALSAQFILYFALRNNLVKFPL